MGFCFFYLQTAVQNAYFCCMIRFLTFTFCLLLLLSCGEDSSSPEAVTRQFITKMGAGDNDGASLLATERTQRFLAFRTQSMEMLGEDPEQPMIIDYIKCDVEENESFCEFCCDPNGEKMTIPLVKQEGKWLVDIEIDSLIEEFEKEMEKGEE